MLFSKTIDDGQRVAVWSNNGKVTIVDGPKRIGTFMKRIEHLRKHYADHAAYLEVTRKDGSVEIMPGPVALFEDPVLHQHIRVKPAMLVDASEALVVYKGAGGLNGDHAAASNGKALNGDADQTSRVVRRVVRGPARFIPAADEWVHKFEWSGQPKDGSKTTLQPRALQFDLLKTVPASIYHNVNEVRTNDDTLITVKLMLFHELRDIETMLDRCSDPIGDFINAASADVIAFCATLNYETFLNETHRLNELSTFGQLCTRARHIGFEITKVVFRGFQAGDKLQAMHDNAIQERTRLRLLEETQQQEQRAHDLELAAKQRRATQTAELAAAEAQQKADLSLVSRKALLQEEQMADDAAIEKARRQHEAGLEQERAAREASLAHEKREIELMQARNAEQLQMMEKMHKLGVDLTKVLVSQHEQPDRVIKLETNADVGAKNGGENVKGLLGALRLNL